MSLVLPQPRPPLAKTAPRQHLRAYQLWQTGQGHANLDRWGQAAEDFSKAQELTPQASYGLAAAHALIKAGRAADAVASARALCRRYPEHALGYTLTAHALLALGRNEEAVQALQCMPQEVPRDHQHLLSLALGLQRCQRHADAVPVFFDALARKMDDAYLHFHLGMSFKELGLKAEAAECVRTAVVLGLGSSDLAARGQLWFLEREACRWPQAEEVGAALRAAVQALPPGIAMEASPFTHAVLVHDAVEVMKVAQHHALHVRSRVRPLPRRAARDHGGRLRLGYLSADFHTHATSQLMAQMLESHDRQAFEVTLFSSGPDDASPMRHRMVRACEHFQQVRGLGFEAIAQRVRDSPIDILIDLKGATYDTLLPALAHRPAPVQATWLGFPGSTGAPYIDYIIGDPIVTPLAHATHFSEKIAQLPGCYQPNDRQRDLPPTGTRAEWGVPERALLLCAFHQSYKISSEVFDTWCQLLHERADAVLWLLHWNTNVENALREAARVRGISPERLCFAPVVPLSRHLGRLACADIYLDAWPCNAHTTASEALWMGVPVVSLVGSTFAQRVGASLLHAAGLDELACTDVPGYRQQVLALADQPQRRAALRRQLQAQRATCDLFDGPAQARHLEALLQRMWQRAVSGQPPEHLEARA